jgi:hypothetical protein
MKPLATTARLSHPPSTRTHGSLMKVTTTVTCAAALLLVAGCGPDAASDSSATLAADAAAAAATPSQSDRGAGTLHLNGQVHQFGVARCNLSDRSPGSRSTLSGGGRTADGVRIGIQLEESWIGEQTVHTAVVTLGEVQRNEGEMLTAQRIKRGGAWASARTPATEPLFDIDGRRFRVNGQFGEAGGSEPGVEAVIDATCPD